MIPCSPNTCMKAVENFIRDFLLLKYRLERCSSLSPRCSPAPQSETYTHHLLLPVRVADSYGSPVPDGFQTPASLLEQLGENAVRGSTAGYIIRTVLDQSGAVRAGAEVHLTDEDQASNLEVKSGSNGQFVFANVAPGPFRLTVTSAGFATREFSAALRPGETYLVPPIIMAVATAVTEVHVKDSPLTQVPGGGQCRLKSRRSNAYSASSSEFLCDLRPGRGPPLNTKAEVQACLEDQR